MNDVIFSKKLKVLITSDTTRQHHINVDIERTTELRTNVFHIRLTGTNNEKDHVKRKTSNIQTRMIFSFYLRVLLTRTNITN